MRQPFPLYEAACKASLEEICHGGPVSLAAGSGLRLVGPVPDRRVGIGHAVVEAEQHSRRRGSQPLLQLLVLHYALATR